MMYEQYGPYAELGKDVIRSTPSLWWIAETDVRVGFLRSFKEKVKSGKYVLGECIKVSEVYEPFCPFDFLIVFYEENIVGLTEQQLRILMHHELLHIGFDEKDGELKYRIAPHDIEEFKEIADRYGLYWDRPGAGGGG